MIIKWLARISALGLLIFTLPFYFGYGNPLPFINPDYSWWENLTLAMMPIIFFGLAWGWKNERIGGLLIVTAVILSWTTGLVTSANLSINLLAPIVPGVLYLVAAYKK